ncbi:MAG: CDP-diacylglycerol--glycerol-3-phosphate 3-phosphatidyltransferase [Eubacteriaceae bacterium]|nr:CDP-diacylglycerol--glycerol-3-phosphate 3-phosphatidyltransferase [Eubacteriaceae bacterium]
MKNIPNILSGLRILLVPVFVYVFFSDLENARLAALGVYAAASFTDLLDGYIARKYNYITDLGKVLDPFADKLMLLTVLVSLYLKGIIPGFILPVVIIKEAFLILSTSVLFFRKDRIVIPANIFGKSATVLFTVSIVLMMIFPENKQLYFMLYASIVLTMTALVSYLYTYWQAIKKRRTEEKQGENSHGKGV